MKRFLILAAIAVICFSCKGEKGDPGEGMNWKIADVSVTKWDYSGFTDNNYFYAKFDVPALTSFVFTDGNVQGYIYMTENGQRIQHSLPYVIHISTTGSDGQPYYYTRTVDFVYGVGWVQFEVRESDFAYESDVTINPDPMDFRIVMTY